MICFNLALIVAVLAGGPAFFISYLSAAIREKICTFQHSTPTCSPSSYRSYDGSCNNLQNPLWGTANSFYGRLLPAYYGDGVSTFQRSVTNQPLPNPRKISTTVFGDISVPDPVYTIAMMQYGQFITHDLGFGLDGNRPSCCSGLIGQLIPNVPDCDAIHVPSEDPVLPSNITCMFFTRDATSADLSCPAPAAGEPVEQISSVTTYLDLSVIYGNSEELANFLRKKEGGLFRMVETDGHEYPLHDPNPTVHCRVHPPQDLCYIAGDERLNQSPHLTIIHILFIREHNRLARALAALNPHWNDEKLFQEARKINIAQHQYISYYEWLTIFLGTQNMLNLGMIKHFSGDEYVNDYDSSAKPATFNEFSNAAFRFFHSQIEGHLNLLTESREIIRTVAISDHFNNPNITQDYFDELARGMVYQNSQLSDTNFDQQIRDFLFKGNKQFGHDLMSIDIQRGRDHGIARYNDYREYCGIPRATQWDDYLDLIPANEVANLELLYQSFEDVEMVVGGPLETIIDEETLAGPTILCILNKQFITTRISDRYWFESGDPLVAFTRQQLNQIRKTSFARILCDNSNNITTVQPQAFFTVNDTNPIVPCSQIPTLDLSFWQES
ncbi:peroxidase-like [Chironomus tepperi]|uniref:peroxidase-like n=1 Tax=Chironomus tepperi TaxID=113505 RepID=UPI00391FAB4E